MYLRFALVDALVPGGFTTDAIVNDRYIYFIYKRTCICKHHTYREDEDIFDI